MAKFIVKNTTIMHNKKTYSIGKEIELTDNEAIKLADYITPAAAVDETNTDSTSTKATRASKKADKTAADTTTTSTEEVANDEKKEDINGTETVQTTSN